MPGPLEDFRVIDFTHALAGPFCVMLLGHLGADIIKVEPPNGDEFRRLWMPPGAITRCLRVLVDQRQQEKHRAQSKDAKGSRASAPAHCAAPMCSSRTTKKG